MIMEVIKQQDGSVMVFDGKKYQIPVYQGRYEGVKAKILRDAPPQAKFFHSDGAQGSRIEVPRRKW